jgi:hypothetical protein
MLNQIPGDLFSYLITYSSNLLTITFYIFILVFAILIFKRNSYNYGITLIISSILILTSNLIYMSVQYPYMAYRLEVELGLPWSIVILTIITWNLVFLILNSLSAIFLVVSIYLIYKTHRKDRAN